MGRAALAVLVVPPVMAVLAVLVVLMAALAVLAVMAALAAFLRAWTMLALTTEPSPRANSFALETLQLPAPPTLEPKVVGMMNLKGVEGLSVERLSKQGGGGRGGGGGGGRGGGNGGGRGGGGGGGERANQSKAGMAPELQRAARPEQAHQRGENSQPIVQRVMADGSGDPAATRRDGGGRGKGKGGGPRRKGSSSGAKGRGGGCGGGGSVPMSHAMGMPAACGVAPPPLPAVVGAYCEGAVSCASGLGTSASAVRGGP